MKKNTQHSIVALTVSALAALVLVSPASAHGLHLAQSEGLVELREDIAEKTATLQNAEVKDDQEDIATRKAALEKIFEFSIEEAKEILGKKRLQELTKEEPYKAQAETLIENIETQIEYIEGLLEDLEEDQTLEEVKTMPADFKMWRKDTFDPTLKNALDLLLVDKGNRVLATAKTRFVKIQADVLKLEALKQAEGGLFNDSIDKVDEIVDKIEMLQDKAKGQLEYQLALSAPAPETPAADTRIAAATEDLQATGVNEDTATPPSGTQTLSIAAAPVAAPISPVAEGTLEIQPMVAADATTEIAPAEEVIEEPVEKIEEVDIQELVQEIVQTVKEGMYQEFIAMSKLARELLTK